MAVGRTLTKKGPNSNGKRNSVKTSKISAPVALISTTNMISYTAPSLRSSNSYSSISSSGSPTSAKFPSSPFSTASSDGGLDSPRTPLPIASMFSSPNSPTLPPLMHKASQGTSNASGDIGIARTLQQRIPPPPPRPTAQPPKAIHFHMPRPSINQHPFGAELAQVAEMTEQMGMNVRDAEEEFMISHGLQKFRARDYEDEIWQDVGNVFEDALPMNAGWI